MSAFTTNAMAMKQKEHEQELEAVVEKQGEQGEGLQKVKDEQNEQREGLKEVQEKQEEQGEGLKEVQEKQEELEEDVGKLDEDVQTHKEIGAAKFDEHGGRLNEHDADIKHHDDMFNITTGLFEKVMADLKRIGENVSFLFFMAGLLVVWWLVYFVGAQDDILDDTEREEL